jgi:dTDP-4-amino-4,6-dideoxygalactose transaminase
LYKLIEIIKIHTKIRYLTLLNPIIAPRRYEIKDNINIIINEFNKIISISLYFLLRTFLIIKRHDKNAIKKARFWATQARDNYPYYYHTELGYNYRLSNISAGIGRGQLKAIDKRLAKKKEIYTRYMEAFKDIKDISLIPVSEGCEPNFWLSVIYINKNSSIKPENVITTLCENNVEARYVWRPMHIQPYYSSYPFFKDDDSAEISVAEDIFNQGVCLPSDTKMTNKQQDYVIDLIKSLWVK